MTNFDAANGMAAAFAFAFSFAVPKEQVKAATGLYLLVAANWWFYVASNEPVGPLVGLWATDIYLRYDDAWALIDALTAAFAALASWQSRAWWFAAVYALGLCQIGFHIAYWHFAVLDGDLYYRSLNLLFWGILAAVIFAGGKGVKDRIVRSLASARAAYRARAAQGGFRQLARLVRPE